MMILGWFPSEYAAYTHIAKEGNSLAIWAKWKSFVLLYISWLPDWEYGC